ncbi:MAG: rRNA maturation RNase YbeY [Woeseiaceae bacterium]
MTKRDSLVVDIQVAAKSPDIPPAREIKFWVGEAVDAAGTPSPVGAEVSVRIVDSDEIQALNRDYRDKDKVTNVLSFPTGEIVGLPDDTSKALGDIVVCAAVVGEEAASQRKATANHWAHLLVHGTLHLLGYDHEADAEAIEMERLETRILVSNGLPDPYPKS